MFTVRHSYSSAKIVSVVAALLLFASLLGAAFSVGVGSASAQEARRFALTSVVATITNVNLLDQPAATGHSIVELPVNTQAFVMGGPFNDDSWYWLDANGVRGYVPGKALVQVDSNYKPVSTETPAPAPSPTSTTPVPTTEATPGGPTATPTTVISTPSTPGDYTGLWLGELTTGGNVRVGPGLDQKVMKSWWAGRRVLLYQSATDAQGGVWYRVSEPPEAPMWVHSSLVRKVAPVEFQPARFKGRWVDVNISQQITTAYENGTPVKVTLCSTGKGKNETNLGTWKIYWRLPKQDMEGGNKAAGDYYNLKDVPYPQYFNMTGESLHGTYWHDDFGRVHSHGCVNLSIPMSQWFYNWDSIGTIVYVHN